MSLLDVKGIGDKTVEKLSEGGIKTLEQLSVMRPDELKGILNISLKQAKEIILNAKSVSFSDMELLTAEDYETKVKNTIRFIKTGSEKLDEILGGGWRSQSTHGFYGPFSTGKTQIVDTAVVNCVADGLYALFVETETNTFNTPRLQEIAMKRGLEIDLSKVIVYPAIRIGTIFAQFKAYEFLMNQAEKNQWNVGLVAVDSFSAKFRRAYSGREMYPERAQEFGRHLDFLEEMGKKLNAAILLTFQVGVTPDDANQKGDMMRYDSQYYPYGGTLVLHNVNTWLSLNQVKGGAKSMDIYESNLVDSSYLPKASCQFIITERGVEDV